MKVCCYFNSDMMTFGEEMEYFMEHDKAPPFPYLFLDVNISEDAPIQELISYIHEHFQKPTFVEIVYHGGEVKKMACSYLIHSCKDQTSEEIEDTSIAIKEFPKLGPNDELCIQMNDQRNAVN